MESKRLTDWQGTDNFPMWHGDKIYFTSDREHTLNLFEIDVASGETRKVTTFEEYDVLWPSLGPESIVFVVGGAIYRYDFESGAYDKLPITFADDRAAAAPYWDDVSDNIATVDLSPDGKRAIFEARGDIYTVPAKDGPTRNLTRTQGVRESAPDWSPDGRWIAYWSDATGEMELYIRDQDGSGEPRQLTKNSATWHYPAEWSPDGKWLAFADSRARLNILNVDSGKVTEVARGTHADIGTYRWSPDSRWIAYGTNHPSTELPCISVYSVDDKKTWVLGDGMTSDTSPAFSPDGNYLFFLSNRDYNLNFSDFEFNYIYDNATRVYAAALNADADALFPLKSDEVEIEEDEEEAGEKGDDGKDEKKENGDEKKELKVTIDADGFVARTVALPGVAAGNYSNVSATEGAVYYIKAADGSPPSLMRYDLEKREEKAVQEGVGQYVLGARGKKVLLPKNGGWAIAAADPGAEAKPLDLSGLREKIDPRKEWPQMFHEAWRIGRDWFYDDNMHGIDWQAMRQRYGALLPHVSHRSDLDFILGEMIGELEAGHAYVQNGETDSVERVEGGMLGAEFEADGDRYRIAKILPGENWYASYRSPLTEPGVDVSEGDYLLAIDGIELTTADNPYRLLEGKANAQVVLTVGAKPSMDDSREVKVQTVANERNLRYLDWIQTRAAMADKLSGGKVGYIHLPNTAVEGNRALQKFYYGQVTKPALIVDDRYNGGGFIPDRMMEILSRNTLSYWMRRGVKGFTAPGFRHDGPKAMLINGYAASGGDALPYYFRKLGLGKLIGTTTWGGLIGISGNPQLVDGGGVLYPTFRIYDTDGNWVVENIGVAPDIEVWDLPEKIAAGEDPSIEAAVKQLLEELKGFEGDPEQPTPRIMRP
jgi:tricorn protease